MEILNYQKINAQFKPWTPVYLKVAAALIDFIQTERFAVIHIGSTSFRVGGKGIVDLSVLYQNGDLNLAAAHLATLGFQDQISANPFPAERPRKDGAVVMDGETYLLHVHVIARDSEEHAKQLRYKEYMLASPAARREYETLKREILTAGVTDQDLYGKQKSPYVKSVLEECGYGPGSANSQK